MPQKNVKNILSRIGSIFLTTAGVFTSLFIIAVITYLLLPTWVSEMILLAAMGFIGFIHRPLAKGQPWARVIDALLIIAGIAVAIYIIGNLRHMTWEGAQWPTTTDLIVDTVGTLVILELARRYIGWFFVTIMLLSLCYAFWGQFLPGLWGHPAFSYANVMSTVYGENGIFSSPMRVMVRYIFLFLLFGEFLNASGVGRFIIDLANAVAGRARGGPAKISVIASALFGSISGSSLANVYATGVFTIPMMKKLGYKSHFAAAVEATASNAGQWTPPVMGGAAFLLAEWVGISYAQVMLAAAIPAFLYYLCVYLQIDLEAVKEKLRGLSPEETPKLWPTLKRGGYLFLPLVVLVVDLLVFGRSIIHAGLTSMVSAVVLSWIRKDSRIGVKKTIAALSGGARAAVPVTAACAACGIIIGVLMQTGLGVRLSALFVHAAGGNGFLLIVFTAMVGLILGMGMPTAPAYIIVAAVMVPALVMIGFPMFSSHLLALYYAIINGFTPPVAIVAFGAAALAGAPAMRTAITASRLAIMAYFVPIFFMYNTAFLLEGTPVQIFLAVGTASAGLFVLAPAITAYFYFGRIQFNAWQRIVLGIAAAAMLSPVHVATFFGVGTAMALVVIISHSAIRAWLIGKFTRSTPASGGR
ncbi:MAG: TRAP transporter fused permease subunit [Chloroflexota bacterium]